MNNCKRVTLRLYSGQDDDLLDWLASLSDKYGAQSVAIKETLRRNLSVNAEKEEASSSKGSLDTDTLSTIRKIMENVVRCELDQVQFMAREHSSNMDIGATIDEDIESQLDKLGTGLMMGEL
ncbi:MAG: hypothetical protein U9Q82_07825 [Chloroflexota bacterium]|nr:hypothetical protein [Chloroflexota bacterium]